MRYTYEFKKHCVDLYRKGQYPKAPEGIFPFSPEREMCCMLSYFLTYSILLSPFAEANGPLSPEREIFRKLSYTPTYNYEQSS